MGFMKGASSINSFEELVGPLADCLTPESARKVLAMKPSPGLKSHMDEMASRHSEGTLSPQEEIEYGRFVTYATFVAVLKSKARQLLAELDGD
jgi:hypothetical protein